MPNDWLLEDEAAKPGLSAPKPELAGELKTLKELGDARQLKSETPVVAPVAVPVEPVEVIPYKEVKNFLEDSAKAIIDSTLNAHKATISLSKLLAVLPTVGHKGDEISTKVNGFKGNIEKIIDQAEMLSRDLSAFNRTMHDEAV